MIEFFTVDGKRKARSFSATPGKAKHPALNRSARRALIYAAPVKRLIDRIHGLRKDIKDAGMKLPPFPKFNNRKVMSAHMGVLCELARSSPFTMPFKEGINQRLNQPRRNHEK